MNRHLFIKYYIISVFLLLVTIYNTNTTISASNHSPVFLYNINDSIIDGSCFIIDDSLLCAEFPEVMVKPRGQLRNVRNFTHLQRIHYTPINSQTKEFIIIASKDLYDSISIDIQKYAEDIHSIYGYGVFIETVNNPTSLDIKSLLQSYQNNLCGALFVGNIPECQYETDNDYNRYGYKKWPCDLYYMDLDGVWTDNDSNGVFDSHAGNVAPDIFLGRISTKGLPSSMGSEVSLIKFQLAKSHNYWWNQSYHTPDTVLNYIDKDWNYMFSPNDISQVFSSGKVDDIRYGTDSIFSPSDYLYRLNSNNYGFLHLAAHSSPSRHAFTTGSIYIQDLLFNQSNCFAENLFCCSACNWLAASSQGYLGGVYLYNHGKTLAVVGSTKTGSMLGTNYFYSYLPNYCLGESFLLWWRNFYGSNHTNNAIFWSYGMTILGDPTINFRHQVSNFCERDLVLNYFPADNHSNHILYKAENSITITSNFIIPEGVHVVFDAPNVVFELGFSCPVGASFETRNEGCKL